MEGRNISEGWNVAYWDMLFFPQYVNCSMLLENIIWVLF